MAVESFFISFFAGLCTEVLDYALQGNPWYERVKGWLATDVAQYACAAIGVLFMVAAIYSANILAIISVVSSVIGTLFLRGN